MLDKRHNRHINNKTDLEKNNEKEKNNYEETRQKCRLATASNEITEGGGGEREP